MKAITEYVLCHLLLILCNSGTGDTCKIHVAWKTEVC